MNHEISLEDRLRASLRSLKRNAPPKRSQLASKPVRKSTRIATLRAPSAISDGCLMVSGRKSTAKRPAAPKRPKRKPLRFGGVPQNPKYLEFVRCLCCILYHLQSSGSGTVHVCSGEIQAAHTGRHGRGQKAADETALPMCNSAHQSSKFSHHKLGKKFWSFWGLDREKLVQSFNEMARESEVLVQEFEA